MIIKSIHIKEGFFGRFIEFSDSANLIHSKQNSKGKTTLLRFLLYSLGYNIPNTKNIKFERCEVETVVYSEKIGDVTLSRTADSHIVLSANGDRTTYVLPEQQNELHSVLFGTENADILGNLLGAFYVDQEKGWTLLNRGVVIGSIRFNIEELIRGLSGRDCISLIQQEAKLSRELGKYKQMFSVAQYQETIEAMGGSLAIEPYNEKIDSELEQLRIRQNALKKELRRLDRAIKDNRQLSKFIAEMKLLIKGPDGTTIPVTAENIVGFEDSIEYLITKHKLISAELVSVLNNINALEAQRQSEDEQLSFWECETMTQAFDRRIASLQINAVAIEKEIKRLEKELRDVRQAITDRTKTNNDVVNRLYQSVLKYAAELGIGGDTTITASYLFTSNLKELSGAVLHKTVFAFRLAYIIEIERTIGVKLPIILDSPSGKEVDQENIKLMMDILKRDFSDHQIIIASIFTYDFDTLNVIEIVNQLIEIE
ncbi:MAG: hypothetical protein SOV58_00995 [Candidatus Enteromonas sp.]|nr:hypothetical protein [Candidatus Enteromonas sp.]